MIIQPPVQIQPKPAIAYESRAVQARWWDFLRVALIAWSAIGVAQVALGLTLQRRYPSVLLPLDLLNFAAMTTLLVGAISAKRVDSSNTLLTIGAVALLLYAILDGWLSALLRQSYPISFLAAAQFACFPIAVVLLKVRGSSFGSATHLLIAAQIPGIVGIGLMVAMFAGWITAGYHLSYFFLVLILSIAGSAVSTAASFLLIKSPCGVVARNLGIIHGIYLLAILTVIAAFKLAH
jgi:hypothetical protein